MFGDEPTMVHLEALRRQSQRRVMPPGDSACQAMQVGPGARDPGLDRGSPSGRPSLGESSGGPAWERTCPATGSAEGEHPSGRGPSARCSGGQAAIDRAPMPLGALIALVPPPSAPTPRIGAAADPPGPLHQSDNTWATLHQADACRPCIFAYHGLCERGGGCNHCHFRHSARQLRRANPSQVKRSKLGRRIAAREAGGSQDTWSSTS